MITYKAFVADNADPIVSQSDETVQAAVYDWFKYRYIGFDDTAKFLDILQRNVSINYPIYKQKLRIEPGVSSYDWLVSTYRERQLKSTGESANTHTHGQDIINRSGTETTSGETIYNTSTSAVRTGGQTVTHTGTDTTADTGTDTRAKTGTDKTDGTDTSTQTRTGGVTEKSTEGTHTQESETVAGLHTQTTSPHVQTVTTQDNGHGEWSGSQTVQSSLPMSKSYDTMIEPSGTSAESDGEYYEHAYQHMPALDWSTLSAQQQDGHRGYASDDNKQTVSYVYDDGVSGDIVTTQGSSTSPDTVTQTKKGDSTDPDVKVTTYDSDKTAVDKTASTTVTYATEDKETRDLTSETTHDTTDKTVYDSISDAGTHTGTDTATGSKSTSDTSTSTYGDITDSGTDARTDREQVTGRNEDPATLLLRATAFIEQSSAFKWFKEQIDSCFYPGYYTDEDTEEGSCLI